MQLLADGRCTKHDLELADFTPHMELREEGEEEEEEEEEGGRKVSVDHTDTGIYMYIHVHVGHYTITVCALILFTCVHVYIC